MFLPSLRLCGGDLAQAFHVLFRRHAEYAFEFAAELGGAFVAHGIGGGAGVVAVVDHQTLRPVEVTASRASPPSVQWHDRANRLPKQGRSVVSISQLLPATAILGRARSVERSCAPDINRYG